MVEKGNYIRYKKGCDKSKKGCGKINKHTQTLGVNKQNGGNKMGCDIHAYVEFFNEKDNKWQKRKKRKGINKNY